MDKVVDDEYRRQTGLDEDLLNQRRELVDEERELPARSLVEDERLLGLAAWIEDSLLKDSTDQRTTSTK